ncbi:MAG: hypothetical protein HC877_17950 [Thioploca sp.]|nr:hypothetical protein [Thioploca sp.]
MQPATFANLVEQVQQLSTDEKQELWQLLEKYLLEERRNDILCAYQEARMVEDTLEFSNDIHSLKKRFHV